MPTSQPTPFLSEIEVEGARIPEGKLVYLRERTRNRLYDFIVRKFMAKGITQATLARRIGRRPEVVNRWLGSPGNLTIDSLSDLLVGIGAEELEPASSSLLGRAARNHIAPEWHKSVVVISEPPANENPSAINSYSGNAGSTSVMTFSRIAVE